jgi:hypothetical protein
LLEDDGSPIHGELVTLSLAEPPALNDSRGVFFDFEAGWVTPVGKLHQHQGSVDALMEVVAPIAFGALAVTMVGPWIAQAGGLASVPGAAIAGAAGTVGTSLVATGSVRLKDVLRGAATAALTAGAGPAEFHGATLARGPGVLCLQRLGPAGPVQRPARKAGPQLGGLADLLQQPRRGTTAAAAHLA